MSSPNAYKNQHYLPQFYLKGFEASGQVLVLRRGHQYWSQCGVKSVARADYLHSVREANGDWNHEIEEMFSQIEAIWKPLLAKILSKRPLSNVEDSTLAECLGVFWKRTPTAIEPVNQVFSDMLTQVLHLAAGMSGRSDDFSNMRIRHSPLHAQMMAVETGIDMGKHIWAMEWTFIESRPPHFFICSDHPVCLVNPGDLTERVGLLNRKAEFTLPLSKTMCFFAGWKKPLNWRDPMTAVRAKGPGRRSYIARPEEVADINKRTAMFARRELIASSRNFPAASEITEAWRQMGARRDDEPEEIARFSLT